MKIQRSRGPPPLRTALIPEIEIWFILRLVLLSWLQIGWTGSSESKVRQMEESRGSDRLAGGPPSIFLLERHWSQPWGNLLSSQACSFMSDEICYRGKTQFFDCEKSCNDSLCPQHWVRDVGFAAGESWRVRLALRFACCVTLGWWLNLSKPMLLPLQTKDFMSAPLLVLWGLKEMMYAKSLAWGLLRVTVE